LFSESPSRFLLEVPPDHLPALTEIFGGLPLGTIGKVVGATGEPSRLTVLGLDGSPVIDVPVSSLKNAWQRPLRW
jgi:phosphoribosylformylglycinamidine (FGAM) synthase-like enzyme